MLTENPTLEAPRQYFHSFVYSKPTESAGRYSEKELPPTSRNTMRRTGKRRSESDGKFFERGYDDDYPALEARFKLVFLIYVYCKSAKSGSVCSKRKLEIVAGEAGVFLAPLAAALIRRDYPSNDYWRRRDLEDEKELSRRDLDTGELFGRVNV